MKLHNKKTGETGYLQNDTFVKKLRVVNDNNDTLGEYNSLAELNEDWEDYIKEPKKQFYIDCAGRIFENHTTEYIKGKMQEIGNYFKTKEEAEKALENLKAWKRLKDKGFKFVGWRDSGNDNEADMCLFKIYEDGWGIETCEDICLLFGGEE